MNTTATAAEVRQSLHNDNGWAHETIDAFLADVGTETRTRAAWEEAIAEWQGR